jgi:hypothetical protein
MWYWHVGYITEKDLVLQIYGMLFELEYEGKDVDVSG